MRKLLFSMLALLMSVYTFGQEMKESSNGISKDIASSAMSTHHGLIVGTQTDAPLTETSVWALPDNGGTSQNNRAPSNYFKYQRTEYLITPAEMTASGFTSGLNINSIGFLVQTAGTGTLSGTLNIYLKNTTDATYTLGNSWTTSGFTQVSTKASYSVQINNNAYYVIFTAGTPFTYSGSGVYVAWEFSSTGTVGSYPVTHFCNTSLTNGLRGANNASALPTTLSASNYRPATIFSTATAFTDVVNVTNIYTLGKLPNPYGTPAPLAVRVSNVSASAASFDLTITVKDYATNTLRYSYTQTGVSVAANTSSTINFTAWSPSISEDVYITASASTVTGEDWVANNSLTVFSTVNTNLFSYSFGTPVVNSNYGYTYPGFGIFS